MQEKLKSYMMEQLESLMAIDSPVGYTKNCENAVADEMRALGFTPVFSRKGGVYAHVGGSGNPIAMLAHIDTLGAVVTHIKSNGRLRLSTLGGLSPNNTETENVRIITRFDGIYEGTIQLDNASGHVRPHNDIVRNFKTNIEVVLDEFSTTKAETEALGISAGDFVALDPRYTVTKKGYIKSRFLDDKAAVAILLAWAKRVKEENITLDRSVYIGFTTLEEIGYGGASGIPDDVVELLAVDMGCVGDDLSGSERKVSICAKDAGGPYNNEVTTALIKAAKDNGIDYAVDVYNSYGSDVEVSLRAGYDVLHGLIGPGVYASHGYERTHIDGMTATFDLICAYLG